MPLKDFESSDENTEYKLVGEGLHTVKVDDASGDMTNGKCKLKVRFRIQNGDFANQCLFKDYYLTEKTTAKFLPWQFGILGIWKAVREADNFEKGLELAIDAIGTVIEEGKCFDVEVEHEDWEYNGKSGTRANPVLKSENLGTMKVPNHAPQPSFDSNEEIPF